MAGLDIETLEENFTTMCYDARVEDESPLSIEYSSDQCELGVFYAFGVSDIKCGKKDKCLIAEDIQEWREKYVQPDPLGDHI